METGTCVPSLQDRSTLTVFTSDLDLIEDSETGDFEYEGGENQARDGETQTKRGHNFAYRKKKRVGL